MKLLRVGAVGHERPAALDDEGELRDLSSLTDDIDGRLLGDPVMLAAVGHALRDRTLPVHPMSVRVGAPIARPGKVIGIGLNYSDHAAESGASIPDEPVVFLKPGSSVCGPLDTIELPPDSTTTDYEVELGVVVGRRLARCDDPIAALAAVGGYLTANDVTERSRVAAGPTWAKGKCADTFTPIGPWLVTPDEVGDPQALALSLLVNGEVRQSGSTALMAFGVGELLAYVSTLMTLEPGDLVLTGTPGGVAAGRPDPKPYLRDGDIVAALVSGLGAQRTPVAAFAQTPAASSGRLLPAGPTPVGGPR